VGSLKEIGFCSAVGVEIAKERGISRIKLRAAVQWSPDSEKFCVFKYIVPFEIIFKLSIQ
jgi:hypothetical protein